MTPAAKRLGLTQSSVSQIIGNLEESVGAELFDRSIRPLALTAVGTTLYEKGRALLAAAGDTYQMVREDTAKRLASLTIAMAESAANTLGPLLVQDKKSLAERWRIWSGISPENHAALLSHAVDMIVTTSDELDAVEGLEHHPIVTEPFVLVFAAGYGGPSDSLEALADMPFVRYSLRSAIGRQIERQINRLRLDLPMLVEFDTATAQLAAVADGMGWSMTTPFCLLQELDKLPRLRVEPLTRHRFTRQVKLVARRGDLGSAPAQLAVSARRILAERCLPRLLEVHPWIGEQLVWPDQDELRRGSGVSG